MLYLSLTITPRLRMVTQFNNPNGQYGIGMRENELAHAHTQHDYQFKHKWKYHIKINTDII